MGLEKDLPPGEQLLTLFRPFLEHLAASNLSPKTIQKHVDNMWALGGEFIRDLPAFPTQWRTFSCNNRRFESSSHPETNSKLKTPE